MNVQNVNVIARYEVKLLKRSWLFRIFAILMLLILTITQLTNLTAVFWKYSETWNYTAVSSLIPFFTIYCYNIVQSVIVIFLAGNFLTRDKKLDTAEVIYVRPMSNADYIVGKVWGITRVFIGLHLLTLLIAAFINLAISRSPFDIFPYLFYVLTISLPSLWFILGLSFMVMCLLKNQAVTFIVMLGIVGTIFFYLPERLYGVFDFFGLAIPAIFSDVTGHADIELFLLQRLIYLLLGIGFICFTIILVKRLPHRPWKSKVIGAIASGIILMGGVCGVLYVMHFDHISNVRTGFIGTYNKYASLPKANIVSNDIYLRQNGEEIEVKSQLVLQNTGQEVIPEIILYLNPALEVTHIQSDGSDIPFVREQQVIIVARKLQPEGEMKLTLSYRGEIEENVCYTDIEDKDFLANPVANTFFFRYGKRYVYLSDKYTLLTPECLWYPVTMPPVYPAMPYNVRKDFAYYTLTVDTVKDKSVLSQGKMKEENGKVIFTNSIPLPAISLTIGDYDKKVVAVDSVEYMLYYFRGHDYFAKYFNEISDTLPVVIRDIRNGIEVAKNRSYPFSKFVIAEVPLQFTGYVRNWKGYTEQIMPEIVYIPEKGLTTAADFRAMALRTRDWRDQEEILNESEIQTEMLKNYVQNTFMREMSNDGGMRWSESPEVNKLNIGAMFLGFTGFVNSPEYPVVDIALNMMQNANEEMHRVRFSNNAISDLFRANIYLQDHSFEQALADRTIKPQVFYEMLKLKSNYLKNYIVSQVSVKEFDQFMKDFSMKYQFVEVSFNEFAREFMDRFQIDLTSFIRLWYTIDRSATVILKDADANQIVMDDFTKYQSRLKAFNRSDVDAVITVKVEAGGDDRPGRRGRGNTNQVQADDHNYIIPARNAREIKIITDDRPAVVTVNTSISNNLPNEFVFRFSKVDKEISDTTEGLFVIDTMQFAASSDEIIVDNEDSGFKIIESNQKSKLKDWFNKEEEDKYKNFLPWRTPSKWTAVVNNICYGTPINSAVYKSKGIGANKVEWSAEIPGDNYYEIFIWNSKFETWGWGGGGRHRNKEQRNQTYTIKYGVENEDVTIDLEQEETGWIPLGSFYLPAGTASVTLTDKVSGNYVVADAVKFVLINSN